VPVDAVNAQGERQCERADGNDEANGSQAIHAPLTVAHLSGSPLSAGAIAYASRAQRARLSGYQ
jgi:hypothetical protein